MNIKCPHCGMEYNVKQGDFGKTRTCEVCKRVFAINTAYICPNDGTITWFDSSALEKMEVCRSICWVPETTAVGLFVWAFLLTLTEANSLFDQSFIGLLLGTFFRWQGICGIIAVFLYRLLKELSRPACSKCETRDGLWELNTPMGWKLYKEVYGSEQ